MRCEMNRPTVFDAGVNSSLKGSDRDWSASRSRGMAQRYLSYRKFLTLKNGVRIMLRFLTERDQESFFQLFREAPDEDIRFLKHDVRNLGLLSSWLEHLDYSQVLPLVAVDLASQRFVGGGTLRRGKFAAKHVGEIRLFVSRPFCDLGLGSLLLDELINLAAGEHLLWLRAEVVADHKKVLKALGAKGFEIKALLDDFFLCKNGETRDVMLLMRPVIEADDDEPAL